MQYITKDQYEDNNFIKNILIKNGLKNIQNITRLQSGSRSITYSIDDYIVRFPKADIIWQTMQREKKIIDAVYPHLTLYFKNKIHKIELIENEYPFSISKKFYGKICDGRPESEYALLYQNLNTSQQQKLAQTIAMFFYLIHNIDYSKFDFPQPNETIDSWDITQIQDFDFNSAQQALSAFNIDLNNYKSNHINTTKALCHNDLSGSNILLNPEKEDIVSGIIDFGNAMIIPKYLDFFPLYKIDRQLAVNTLAEYNKLSTDPIEQKQIDFSVLSYIGYYIAKNNSPYFKRILKTFL